MLKQLTCYFALAYSLSWLMWLPLYGPALGINIAMHIPYNHAIGAWGPMIAAIICTGLFYNKQGLRTLFARSLKPKPLIYLAVAFAAPFIIGALALVMGYFISGTPIYWASLFTSKEYPASGFLPILLYNIVFFGFGEEVGWRGFALPLLQKRFNALSAAIILTILWALWHWPLFLYRPGYVSMDVAAIIGWVLSLLTGSILLSWLFNSSKGSVLACTVFHSTVDVAFTANLTGANAVNYMGFLITLWGIATIIFYKPKHLSVTRTSVT